MNPSVHPTSDVQRPYAKKLHTCYWRRRRAQPCQHGASIELCRYLKRILAFEVFDCDIQLVKRQQPVYKILPAGLRKQSNQMRVAREHVLNVHILEACAEAASVMLQLSRYTLIAIMSSVSCFSPFVPSGACHSRSP